MFFDRKQFKGGGDMAERKKPDYTGVVINFEILTCGDGTRISFNIKPRGGDKLPLRIVLKRNLNNCFRLMAGERVRVWIDDYQLHVKKLEVVDQKNRVTFRWIY